MESKKKIGRPKLQKTRCVIYPIRLTMEEKARFDQKAKSEGESLAEWMRKILKNAIK